MATIDSRLLEALEASTCFGIAHDESVPECMQCDVRLQCKKKSEGADIPTPTTAVKVPKAEAPAEDKPKAPKKPTAKKETAKPKASTKKATPATPKKETAKKAPAGNIPDFKAMSLDELKDMAKESNVEWKDYGNDQITRMRLIMALKKAL